MNVIPDVNRMRETAEGITSDFRDEFAKSDFFKKMCESIQNRASQGEFATSFDTQIFGGFKNVNAAKELFQKVGYQAEFNTWSLMVSWGRDCEVIEQN